MAASTGLILAIGGITTANEVVFNSQPINWKIPIATGLAAITFGLAETVIGPDIPRGIALVALVAICLTRVNPTTPSPVESALTWWNKA